jgi:glycogen debranching enzyme
MHSPSPNSRFPIAEAVDVSRRVLARNITSKGLSASIDVYQEVWARDAVIALMGASAEGDETMLAALRVSLECLAGRQDRFGQIPYYVRIKDDRAEFGSTDSNPWFVIGAAFYLERSGDGVWWQSMADAVVRALDWCECRDFHKTGLMNSGECDDWADLLSNRGRVLFPNVLYAHALRLASGLLAATHPDESRRFAERDTVVRRAIQETFWVVPPERVVDESHDKARLHASVTLRSRPFFLSWVSLFEYGDRFDTTGNLLAILCGVATEDQTTRILTYIKQTGLDEPYPVKVLHPPITPDERDWRDYYKVWGCNLPGQYHNGGIWPWVGGLYVAALVKAGRQEQAEYQLGKLALALQAGLEPWECREWIHAQSGQPMGSLFQAWSAGMMLYAAHVVHTGKLDGFVPSPVAPIAEIEPAPQDSF